MMNRQLRTIVSSATLPAVLVAALVGLSSLAVAGSPAGAASTKSSASGSDTKSLKAFQSCLAKHGVKLPASGPSGSVPAGGSGSPPSGGFAGGSGPSGGFPGGSSKSAKAFAACRSKMPAGLGGGFGGGGTFKPTAAQQQALTTFDQCMSAHGVTVSSTATFQTIRSLLQADPTASKACQSDLSSVFGSQSGRTPSPGAQGTPPS